MPSPIVDILLALPVYALVLFRVAGLVMTAPVYGSGVIPVRIRAAITLMIGAMIFPIIRGQAPAELSLSAALVGGVGEMMIGACIGLALSTFLFAGEVAGLMVGRQAGLALGEVYDPTHNETKTMAGQVYTITLVTTFLLAGGHRATMAALLDTYAVIPLLSFQFNETIILLLVEMLSAAFMLGVRLAGPVLIAMFMTATAMSFLSRTMPQFNILTVGFTVRIFVALAVAGLVLTLCRDLLLGAIWDALELIRSVLGLDPSPGYMVT